MNEKISDTCCNHGIQTKAVRPQFQLRHGSKRGNHQCFNVHLIVDIDKVSIISHQIQTE